MIYVAIDIGLRGRNEGDYGQRNAGQMVTPQRCEPSARGGYLLEW
jgi:hypothetical protein